MALTERNRLFCYEYLANGYNGAQAYLKVYPDVMYDTACSGACKLLRKPEVREYIAELQKEKLEEKMLNAEKVLDKLDEIAFSAKEDEYYTTKDKLKALELATKILGISAPDKIEAKIDNQVVFIDDINED